MTPLTREAREAYTKEMGPSRSHTSIVASTGQLSCSRHTHTPHPNSLLHSKYKASISVDQNESEKQVSREKVRNYGFKYSYIILGSESGSMPQTNGWGMVFLQLWKRKRARLITFCGGIHRADTAQIPSLYLTLNYLIQLDNWISLSWQDRPLGSSKLAGGNCKTFR